jgi:hypothetical protein
MSGRFKDYKKQPWWVEEKEKMDDEQEELKIKFKENLIKKFILEIIVLLMICCGISLISYITFLELIE